MKRYAYLLMLPAALLFQTLPAALIYFVPKMAYGKNGFMPESWALPFSLLGLLCCALAGLALASGAAYLTLTRSPKWLAWPLIVIFCVPAWAASALYLHAVLVFLACV